MDIQKITEDIMINGINNFSKEYNVDTTSNKEAWVFLCKLEMISAPANTE